MHKGAEFIEDGSLQGSDELVDTEVGEAKVAANHNSMTWYDFLEDSLASWAEQAQGYRLMHEKAYSHYNKISFNLTIPAIVLSTLTGVANFGQESLAPYLGSDAPLYIGVLSIIAAILSTIAKYVRADEKSETHRNAMVAWDKLYRTVVTELTQPRESRTEPQEFLISYREERHRLSEQSPTIPYKIREWFKQEFKEDFQRGNISPPNILSIGNVEVYRQAPQPHTQSKFPSTPRNSMTMDNSTTSSDPIFKPNKFSFTPKRSASPGGFKNFGIQSAMPKSQVSNLMQFFDGQARHEFESRTKAAHDELESRAHEAHAQLEHRAKAAQQTLMVRAQEAESTLRAKTRQVEDEMRAKAQQTEAELEAKAHETEESLRAKAHETEESLKAKAHETEESLRAKAQQVQASAEMLERQMLEKAETLFRNAGRVAEDLSDLAHGDDEYRDAV
jgi:hypothetical protein